MALHGRLLQVLVQLVQQDLRAIQARLALLTVLLDLPAHKVILAQRVDQPAQRDQQVQRDLVQQDPRVLLESKVL